jgi:hypothetical protein
MKALRLILSSLSKAFLLFFLAPLPFDTNAQQQTIKDASYWLVVHGEFKITPLWSAFIELEERRFINPERALQRSLPYLGLRYKLSPKVSLGAAYLNFIIFSPQVSYQEIDSQLLEQRLNLWISYSLDSKQRWKLRLKNEYRIFDLNPGNGDLDFKRVISRIRLKLAYKYPINKHLELVASGEILVNYAGNTGFKYFDQSRFYLGAKYRLSNQHALELGYLNWHQESRTTDLFYNRQIVRLGWVYSLDFNTKART